MKKNYFLFLLIALGFTVCVQAQVTLTQTTNNEISEGTISCNAGGVTSDNIYYRAFDLTALGYSQFDVNQVTFGIEGISNVSAGFAVDVIIYSNPGGNFPAGTLTQVASVSVPLGDSDAGTLKTVAINASVVAPAKLVVGVSIPNQTGGIGTTVIFLGSNDNGQTAPGYISSAGCGITAPTTLADIGFPDVHIIMDVTGIALGVNEFEVAKVSISPNPATDFVAIELDPSNTMNAVEIYSVTGQLVQKVENQSRINIANLKTGIYMMKVITANGTASKKLVKN